MAKYPYIFTVDMAAIGLGPKKIAAKLRELCQDGAPASLNILARALHKAPEIIELAMAEATQAGTAKHIKGRGWLPGEGRVFAEDRLNIQGSQEA